MILIQRKLKTIIIKFNVAIPPRHLIRHVLIINPTGVEKLQRLPHKWVTGRNQTYYMSFAVDPWQVAAARLLVICYCFQYTAGIVFYCSAALQSPIPTPWAIGSLRYDTYAAFNKCFDKPSLCGGLIVPVVSVHAA